MITDESHRFCFVGVGLGAKFDCCGFGETVNTRASGGSIDATTPVYDLFLKMVDQVSPQVSIDCTSENVSD